MNGLSFKTYLLGFNILFLTLNPLFSQDSDQYYEDFDRTYLQSGTLLFGANWNRFEPLFDRLNFDIFEETAYDFSGTIFADSTNFVSRSNYFGLGFNINGVQCLMSGGFRQSNTLNLFNLGFGMGFNHVLHFDYRTGQPKVWFEGLVNYNYINSRLTLRRLEVTQPPMAFFDGVQFPDIGIVVNGNYRLNVEAHYHLLEPVMAFNFALSKSFGLRFAAAYSLLLNQPNANFLLRFRPDPSDNSLAQAEEKTFEKTLDQINLDNRTMETFPLDLRRFNFNVWLVLRINGSGGNG